MARYRVELVQSIVETAVVFIEANNPDEAERLALPQVTTGSGADWRLKDQLGDIEVLGTQEISTEKK